MLRLTQKSVELVVSFEPPPLVFKRDVNKADQNSLFTPVMTKAFARPEQQADSKMCALNRAGDGDKKFVLSVVNPNSGVVHY